MTSQTQGRGSPRVALSIAGSLVAGLIAAIFLVAGPFAGGVEATITGAVLLAFGLGWALLALVTARLTDQPQRWAFVPAGAMALVGVLLLLLRPGGSVMDVLSWIWPAALLALVAWMVVQVRVSLHSRARLWLIYPVFAVLALFALGGAAEAIVDTGPSAGDQIGGEMVSVGDHRLRVDCQGEGSPVVVLESGLGESSYYWAPIVERVVPTTTVCTYDRAGRGGSEGAASPQDGLSVAKDLHTLLAASGHEGPYLLVGHSTGGVYVRIFAATFPDEVAGMVLLDSQPTDAFTSLPDYPAFYASTPVLYGVLPSVARLGVLHLAYASAFGDLPEVARDAERGDQGSPRLQASARDEMAMLRTSLAEAAELKDLGAMPLIVVTAEAEAQAGWTEAQRSLAALSTNSLHRILPEISHVALITSPAGSRASSQAILDVVAATRGGIELGGP